MSRKGLGEGKGVVSLAFSSQPKDFGRSNKGQRYVLPLFSEVNTLPRRCIGGRKQGLTAAPKLGYAPSAEDGCLRRALERRRASDLAGLSNRNRSSPRAHAVVRFRVRSALLRLLCRF